MLSKAFIDDSNALKTKQWRPTKIAKYGHTRSSFMYTKYVFIVFYSQLFTIKIIVTF